MTSRTAMNLSLKLWNYGKPWKISLSLCGLLGSQISNNLTLRKLLLLFYYFFLFTTLVINVATIIRKDFWKEWNFPKVGGYWHIGFLKFFDLPVLLRLFGNLLVNVFE